jgi:chromosome condensin MukBEF MukE localization factor
LPSHAGPDPRRRTGAGERLGAGRFGTNERTLRPDFEPGVGVGGGETNDEPESELDGDGGAVYADGALDQVTGTEYPDSTDDGHDSGNDEGGGGKAS